MDPSPAVSIGKPPETSMTADTTSTGDDTKHHGLSSSHPNNKAVKTPAVLKESNIPVTKRTPAVSEKKSQQEQDDDVYTSRILAETLVKAETRSVSILRLAVISVLVLTAAVVCSGVYLYTHNAEVDNFTLSFDDSALQVIESFHEMVERNIGALASLATDFTSYAVQQQADGKRSFPFVTLPNFAEKGSHFRALSGSHIVHYTPIVTDETRQEWEQYALDNRQHIDTAFQEDGAYRGRQDELIGANRTGSAGTDHQGNDNQRRLLQQQQQQQNDTQAQSNKETVLGDGTGFHPRIWSNGALVPPGDEPEGSGPYLPAWQRSPISPGRQNFLNLDWASNKVIQGKGVVESMMKDKEAQLRAAMIPIPAMIPKLEGNLRISQYREQVDDFIVDLGSFVVYPVFDSFREDKKVAALLSSNVYWKMLLSNLLPSSSGGMFCVIASSFNQTFTYRLDGPTATFVGMGDPHDPKYDHMEHSANINEYLNRRASPRNRAYNTVPLSENTQYTIKLYPSQDAEDMFVTNRPVIYTVVVITGFVLASVLFLAFSYVVERRQQTMMGKVVENAERITATERELNEFVAHEVRNPLSAAISACSFVSSALQEPEAMKDPEAAKSVMEDMDVVNSSLTFINDFLRSMLDTHRANGNNIQIQKAPTDLLRDILEPVAAILHQRVANFDVIVSCPENLIVWGDTIRLKQVILNLVRNSSKFVERGFIRIRADVIDYRVRIYVEDSGPGIPKEKQHELFAKYQASLDLLAQGTGLGLNLCKKLMISMEGDVWLDESYDSGIEGCPGARFVVQLNTEPIDIESTLPDAESEDEHIPSTSASCDSREVTSKSADNTCDNQGCRMRKDSSGRTSAGLSSEPPIHAQMASTASSLEPPPATPPMEELPKGVAVLFVDDDAVLRKLFMRAVKKVEPSWMIQEASSGEAALRLCETNSFDLIFLDQYMASVDKQMLGTETAQAMRAQGVESIICGLSANDIKDAFANSGADHFFMKPMPCKADILKGTLLGILKTKDSNERSV